MIESMLLGALVVAGLHLAGYILAGMLFVAAGLAIARGGDPADAAKTIRLASRGVVLVTISAGVTAGVILVVATISGVSPGAFLNSSLYSAAWSKVINRTKPVP